MINDLAQTVTSKWWTFAIRGLFAFALAVFAFAEPNAMASGLVYFVAAYFIINGLTALVAGFSMTGAGHWWLLGLTGIAQVALGVVMIAQPGIGPLALAYLVAIYAISTGLLEIASAIQFRNFISNEGWWIFLGVVTLALGVYIVMRPDLGVYALVFAVGFYAALAAGALFALAYRLKKAGDELSKGVTSPAQKAPAN